MNESGENKKQFAVPIEKNQRWIEALEKGINAVDEDIRATIMKPAGESCAVDIRILCENIWAGTYLVWMILLRDGTN
jgi:hypothetical protein